MADIVKRLRSGDVFNAPMTVEEVTVSPVALMAADEIERLRKALRLAIECVEHWAAYADSYSIAKYDLAGDLRDLRAALGEDRA